MKTKTPRNELNVSEISQMIGVPGNMADATSNAHDTPITMNNFAFIINLKNFVSYT